MKLYGPAGDLDINIKDMTVEREVIVLNVEMGIWEHTVSVDSKDIKKLIPFFLSFSVLSFIIKVYISSIFSWK